MARIRGDKTSLAHRSEASAARRVVMRPVIPSPPADQETDQQDVQRDDVLAPDELRHFSAEDKAQGRYAGRPSEIPARGSRELRLLRHAGALSGYLGRHLPLRPCR